MVKLYLPGFNPQTYLSDSLHTCSKISNCIIVGLYICIELNCIFCLQTETDDKIEKDEKSDEIEIDDRSDMIEKDDQSDEIVVKDDKTDEIENDNLSDEIEKDDKSDTDLEGVAISTMIYMYRIKLYFLSLDRDRR